MKLLNLKKVPPKKDIIIISALPLTENNKQIKFFDLFKLNNERLDSWAC